MSNLLKAWLKNNHLTEDPNDFSATVSGMGSKNLDDIVDDIMKDGTENNRNTIKNIVTRFQEKAMQLVLSGHNINTGMVYMRPIIKGPFYDKNWNPETNTVYVAMNQGIQLRKAISDTSVQILGVQPDSMEIFSLTNMVTGSTDGTLIKGRNCEIRGAYIKVVGEDPACGVTLKNTSTQEVTKLPQDAIVLNEPSRLLLDIPENFEPGEYELTITTQYTRANSLLKAPRSVSFAIPVIIS